MKRLITLCFVVTVTSSSIAFSRGANGAESAEFAKRFLAEHGLYLSPAQQDAVAQRLTGLPNVTRNIGTEDSNAQTGPNNSSHPASRQACIDRALTPGHIRANTEHEQLCKARWMAPIRPAVGASVDGASVCIDRFEFPNIPCEYPVVWVAASQAKLLCESQGKRLCDAHEWEGACGGGIREDYGFTGEAPMSMARLRSARRTHNRQRERVRAFNWQPELANENDSRAVCGVYSRQDADISVPHRRFNSLGKSVKCHSGGSDYRSCGSNTWPAGFKYQCVTRDGVFDLHGNVAEVVNFPRAPSARGRLGGSDRTERKGSFFVHRKRYPDDCRVRQPFEHFNNAATDRHAYYQEGFRCCKDVR